VRIVVGTERGPSRHFRVNGRNWCGRRSSCDYDTAAVLAVARAFMECAPTPEEIMDESAR